MTPYDNWLTTTPEDEDDARNARRRARLSAPVDDDAEPEVLGEEADYIYDPIGRDRA